MWTPQPRAGRCLSVVSNREHLAARRAAGGRRSTPASRTRRPASRACADAIATRRARGRAARPRRRAGARPLDRRDRRAAADGPAARRARRRGRRALRGRRRRRGRGDHDHRHAARRTPSSRGAGFTVGGMAKGSGMIHPNLATMLAVVTTDYPLEPGEAIEFLRPAVERQLQRDHGRRRAARRTTRRSCSRTAPAASSGRRRPTRVRRRARARSAPSCARRSSPTARARPCSPRSPSRGAVDDAQAKAIAQRIATSPLVKTALFGHDANWGRVLMAAGCAPFNGGYADVDADRVYARATTARVVLDRRRAARTSSRDVVRRRAARSTSTSASATARAGYLTSDLSYDYVRINADYRS